MTRPLALVRSDPTTEELLRELIPGMIEAERTVSRYKQMISEQGRLLARERGVAFIREETLRREFGG